MRSVTGYLAVHWMFLRGLTRTLDQNLSLSRFKDKLKLSQRRGQGTDPGGAESEPCGVRWMCRCVLNVTSSPIRTGWMPKKGLMAMAGRMGAPGSAGRGAMQTPPVSAGKQPHAVLT